VKRNSIRLLLVTAGISIIGITLTQIYWTRRAFDIKEQEFTVNVSIGLKNVAESVLKYDQVKAGLSDPVSRLSYKYFVVNIDHEIPPVLLDSLLRSEFARRGISTNFGFVICEDDHITYSKCVAVSSRDTNINMLKHLPDWGHHRSYFGVYFPKENGLIFSQMGIWTFSSAVLLMVVIFFCYALFIILRQKRLSEVQKDFVNNMAHEFNTPLSAILASSEVLKMKGIENNPERLHHYAGLVYQEARRLQNQVEKVLEIAASDEERIFLHKETVHLHPLLEKVAESVQSQVAACGGKITLNIFAENDAIEADKTHIANVFYNLVDNAIKYSGARLEIRISTENKPGGINVCIADKGIGVGKPDIRKIFDKFYRVPNGNIHDVKGFGMGLNYVKNIVKAHNGIITVESELTKGSIFCIFLPYK
jgi:two-component system phosphate regulon sensor histidine kinase PhoR